MITFSMIITGKPGVKESPWVLHFFMDARSSVPGYLHYVHAYGRSISYSILFSPTSDTDEDVDEPPCRKGAANTLKPMSEATFTWSYDGGKTVCIDWVLKTRLELANHWLQPWITTNAIVFYDKLSAKFGQPHPNCLLTGLQPGSSSSKCYAMSIKTNIALWIHWYNKHKCSHCQTFLQILLYAFERWRNIEGRL